jgi:hypothetical protein
MRKPEAGRPILRLLRQRMPVNSALMRPANETPAEPVRLGRNLPAEVGDRSGFRTHRYITPGTGDSE